MKRKCMRVIYCNKEVHARGLCRRHYDEIRRGCVILKHYTWVYIGRMGLSLPTKKEAREKS